MRAPGEPRRYVLLPPMPTWLQLATPARRRGSRVAGLAGALLPRWARRLYRLPGLPVRTAATAGLRALHTAMQQAPERYRVGPHLRAAQKRLAQSDSGAMSVARPAQGG